MIEIKALLLNFFKTNNIIIHRQVRGLTHEESLLKPPFRANCLNWVVGHILTGRGTCLSLLGLPPVLTEEARLLYDRGSEELNQLEKASLLEDLIEKLDRSLAQITVALQVMTEEQLVSPVNFGTQPQPLGEALHFLMWHETYHTGQLELLRQLAGKNDKVI